VRLKEIVTSKASEYNQGKGSIYMVMEFMDHDLTGLTDGGERFSTPQIKCYMKQLLEGVNYCHKNKVLHRDIKGSNLLINNEGQLKLADFGLARPFDTDQQRSYTNRVITLWYRPPELLLGATTYGTAIDMWSAGCIFAELLLRKPILPGRNEFEQLELIFKLLGTPCESSWPGCTQLQYYDMIIGQTQRKYNSRFQEKFGQLDKNAQDLLARFLSLDPEKRISAREALDHDYFWTEPFPAKPEQLPKYAPSYEFTAKKRRQAAQQSHPPASQAQPAVPQQRQQASSHTYPPQQQHQQHHQHGRGQGAVQYPPKRAREGPPNSYDGGAPYDQRAGGHPPYGMARGHHQPGPPQFPGPPHMPQPGRGGAPPQMMPNRHSYGGNAPPGGWPR